MGGQNSGRVSTFDSIAQKVFKSKPGTPIEEIELTIVEKEILIRLDFIDGCRRSHFPYKDKAEIKRLYKMRFPDMSDRQFFYDASNAERLFGKFSTINKDYERNLSIEWYEKVASLSLVKGDIPSSIRAKFQADTLKGLYEKDEIDLTNEAKIHVLHLTIENSEGSPINKILELDDILRLPADSVKEILKQTDVPDTTPDQLEQILKEDE